MRSNLLRAPFGRANTVLLLIVAAIAAGAGLWLALKPPPTPDALKMFPERRQVTDFALLDGQEQPLGIRQFQGRWDLVFFGFTNCPDVCPGTLAVLADVQRRLEAESWPAAELPRVTFVSVDPVRDAPARADEYAKYFHPSFRAATGPDAQLAALSRQLGAVYYIPEEAANSPSYNVDHSAAIILLDEDGRLAGLFPAPHNPGAIAEDLKRVIRG